MTATDRTPGWRQRTKIFNDKIAQLEAQLRRQRERAAGGWGFKRVTIKRHRVRAYVIETHERWQPVKMRRKCG